MRRHRRHGDRAELEAPETVRAVGILRRNRARRSRKPSRPTRPLGASSQTFPLAVFTWSSARTVSRRTSPTPCARRPPQLAVDWRRSSHPRGRGSRRGDKRSGTRSRRRGDLDGPSGSGPLLDPDDVLAAALVHGHPISSTASWPRRSTIRRSSSLVGRGPDDRSGAAPAGDVSRGLEHVHCAHLSFPRPASRRTRVPDGVTGARRRRSVISEGSDSRTEVW